MTTNDKPTITIDGEPPKLAKLDRADYDELFRYYYGDKRELDFDDPRAQRDEAPLDCDRDLGE